MGQEYPGWRRSVDRTGLRMNSLQTGNFSGYFTKIGDGVTRFMRETPAPQQILVRFTTEEAGKIISRTRILTRKTGNSSGGNRRVDPEIGVQRAGLSHWSATAFPPAARHHAAAPLPTWNADAGRRLFRRAPPAHKHRYTGGRVASRSAAVASSVTTMDLQHTKPRQSGMPPAANSISGNRSP